MEEVQRDYGPDSGVYHRSTAPNTANTREFRVQLEDGTVETFKVDTRVDMERLPRVLEAAVRARQRQKAGLKPAAQGPPDPPSMFPTSAGSLAANLARGAAKVPLNVIRGAGATISHPLDSAAEMFNHANDAQQRFNTAVDSNDVVGGAKELVSGAIPVLGPMADQLGAETAAGRGGQAFGEVAGNVAAAELGARALGKAAEATTHEGRIAIADRLDAAAGRNTRASADLSVKDLPATTTPAALLRTAAKGYSKVAAPIQSKLASAIRPEVPEFGSLSNAHSTSAGATDNWKPSRMSTGRAANNDIRGAGGDLSMAEQRNKIIEQIRAEVAAAGKKMPAGGALSAKIRKMFAQMEKGEQSPKEGDRSGASGSTGPRNIIGLDD